jgi:hypothetical protein
MLSYTTRRPGILPGRRYDRPVPTHALDVERVTWDSLHPHPQNPRNGDVEAIAESVRVNGVYRPVIVARDGTILAGHHLWYALGELEQREVDVIRLDLDPHSAEAKRLMLADNRTSDLGTYDDSLLSDLAEVVRRDVGLAGTGYTEADLDQIRAALQELEREVTPYTAAIDVPQYTPRMDEPPPVSDLYDRDKAFGLEAQIESTDLPAEVRAFLLAAAQRHVRFDYHLIAEYYAHAPAEVQRLMEESALIILDPEDAIRLGYAKIAAYIAEHLDRDE